MGRASRLPAWFARLKRPDGDATAPAPAPSNHPRELLKAATSTVSTVLSLWLAALLIAGAIVVDGMTEQHAARREQSLARFAFEHKRLAFAAHVEMAASRHEMGPPAPIGRSLAGLRDMILANDRTATADLLVLALSGRDIVGIESGGRPIDPDEAVLFAKMAASLAEADPDSTRFDDIVRVAGQPHLMVLMRHNSTGLRGARAVSAVLVLLPLHGETLRRLESELGLANIRVVEGSRTGDSRSLPLLSRTGETIGALAWDDPDGRADLRRNAWIIAALLAALGVASASAARRRRREVSALVNEVEAQVFDVAMRDPLTGLLNRASFRRRLEALVANRTGRALIGVIYIDLDRFKQVNDGFGHLKGDELLCGVTERLRDLSQHGLSIARLGGDEFAMIVEDRESEGDIVRLAERACSCLGQPFQLGDVEANIGGSVGVAICPEDGEEPQELLRRADIAMYRAKSGGRNMTVRFDSSMDSDVQDRRQLELDLRHALERDELSMAYQPFWASDGKTLVGVEALVRWNHPTRGPMSPAFFVPIAEEAGLIHELGEWTMRRSMQEAKRWKGITLAVNISPLQFKRQGLMSRLRELISETGMEPERLEIEITEGVLMEDADAGVRLIRGFKELGCHVALDDFGTGYSSLSYLRRFPFDKLKVDQSFVKALGTSAGSAAIIHSVIALGRALGLTVHAEGVETLEHHIFLRAAGCHHLQGFYFAKPMSAAEIDTLIETVMVRAATRPIFAYEAAGQSEPAAAAPVSVDLSGDLAAELSAKVAAMKRALGGADTEEPGEAPAKASPLAHTA